MAANFERRTQIFSLLVVTIPVVARAQALPVRNLHVSLDEPVYTSLPVWIKADLGHPYEARYPYREDPSDFGPNEIELKRGSETISSGGIEPVSVTVQHDLVYVVNAGGTPNISGFRIEPGPKILAPLSGSTQNLPGGAAAAPAEVAFNSDGNVLLVTEKGTSLIDTFIVDDDGVALPGVSFPSNGATPFGFAFGHNNVAVVSDAAGGPSGTSALSSYEVDEDGNPEVITPALGDTQKAACWVVVTRNGRFAYTSNTGSNTISSYTISEEGDLALMNVTAANGNIPLDMALTRNGRFLYARNAGNSAVTGFRVEANGSLTPVTSAAGLPAGAAGIAAR